MALYRSDMAHYARVRLAEAERTYTAHAPDAVGCCKACGRPAPCPEVITAVELRERYAAWLAAARQPTDPLPGPAYPNPPPL